jgi:micrococcal nuclease
MGQKMKKVKFISIVVCLLAFSSLVNTAFAQEQNRKGILTIPKRYYLCTRVVDGDTIIVQMKGKEERVRLIGVDTPETKHPEKPVEDFGKKASAFTKRMVEGKKVTLKYDWQRRDKDGRLLAYVYLEDGTFLNAEIVKQGYGYADTRFPFKYLEEFRDYQKIARDNKKGLWSK